MQLSQLRLKNFRNHRDTVINFTKGINGIVGRNGSGKSNVIEAIKFASIGKLDDSKDRVLSVGKATGHVEAIWDINGKPAHIFKSLDTSKTTLEYDGTKKVKASDVKELWSKLFNIDDTIFENVIIARQGDIPLLFSGDLSVREKVFQKIFMVPNTTKLRTLIWDEYIKKAPQEYSVITDVEVRELMLSGDKIYENIEATQKETGELSLLILSKDDISKYYARREFVNSCKAASKNREEWTTLLRSYQDELNTLKEERAKFDNWKDFPYEQFVRDQQDMRQAQQNIVKINSLNTQIKEIKEFKLLSDDEIKKIQVDIEASSKEIESIKAEGTKVNVEIDRRDAMLKDFVSLKGKVTCPTCKQAITDIKAMIDRTESEKAGFTAQRKTLTELYAAEKSKTEVNERIIKSQEEKRKQIESLEVQVKNIGNAVFDEAAFNETVTVLKQYAEDSKTLESASVKIKNCESKIVSLEAKISALPTYDKTTDIEVEVSDISNVIASNVSNMQRKSELEAFIAARKEELKHIQESIVKDTSDREHNKLRSTYLGRLQRVYDLFHTSQFPRKLISSYAGEIEGELRTQLMNFNLPYDIRVTENFSIEAIDEDGNVLPSVSGGQQMVTGLCLRLALHSLFSQSFPLMILDEVTGPLDAEENKPMYFELLKNLKKQTNIKQYIIVDHDASLSTVVDNTIQL